MNWLLEHFQIVLIVALAFASWLKHRSDVKNAEAEERRAREEMAGDDSPFEMEDWQAPASAPAPSVPPPLVRQTIPPPLRVDVSEVDAVLKRQQEIQERLRQIKETKATTTGGAAATRVRVAASQSNAKPLAPGNIRLRDDLQNPQKTRRAIVLREILGPPIGLR